MYVDTVMVGQDRFVRFGFVYFLKHGPICLATSAVRRLLAMAVRSSPEETRRDEPAGQPVATPVCALKRCLRRCRGRAARLATARGGPSIDGAGSTLIGRRRVTPPRDAPVPE